MNGNLDTNDDKENTAPIVTLSTIDERLSLSDDSPDRVLAERSKTSASTQHRLKSPSSITTQTDLSQSDATKIPSKIHGETHRSLKLSHEQITELTTSPDSLPIKPVTPVEEDNGDDDGATVATDFFESQQAIAVGNTALESTDAVPVVTESDHFPTSDSTSKISPEALNAELRLRAPRSTSSPLLPRKHSSQHKLRPALPPLKLGSEQRENGHLDPPIRSDGKPSPIPDDLPIPPLSLPTYLQLELSTTRPSPLYVHHNPSHDFPYESSQIKFERLLNFFRLPPQLEQVLCFGALACLDSWLYTFTILPLRFANAAHILLRWCVADVSKEVSETATFVYDGVGRLWTRRRLSVPDSRRSSFSEAPMSPRPTVDSRANSTLSPSLRSQLPTGQLKKKAGFRHRRTKSIPSTLSPNHKADILQGLLIIVSCVILMGLDASRMYHSIRGQAAIKLYVIYNVLEVFDRLFSALGQDVLECLFSKETLERGADGRSKVFRPLWMFLLALAYNIVHATALFYQLVTLNVAVNSYSNALLTLLMSNQFVEIKGTVFKKFEKENLFQLTCADIVERFQLWLMLLIIAVRNVVEVGGFNISLSPASFTSPANASSTANASTSPFVIPDAFTLMPTWTGEVIGPFLIVLGSEMLVDWLKHAYITKFNNIKPNIYGRFLDVLSKDYYTHAFAEQNLTKRLGLPVIPLSCLFIRASMQTYHMFLATHVPAPIPSTATAVSLETEAVTTPATVKALQHIDHVFRRALGRSAFGSGKGQASGDSFTWWWSLDDMIALTTMIMFFLALFLILLAFKLILGMILLTYSRNRYRSMKRREHQSVDAKGKRIGGWGVVEVGDDKRRWIYEDDADGLKDLQAREARSRARSEKNEMHLDNVDRYTMAAKRIW